MSAVDHVQAILDAKVYIIRQIKMTYKPGDYKVICDRCGFERYASDCRMTWDKLFVCADTCWEEKHPHYSDLKPLGEKQSVPVYRPEPDEVFIDTTDPITQEDL